jgi:hypothetical protein
MKGMPMQQEMRTASADAWPAERPHWLMRCVAAFFAAVAALVIAVMVMLTINNWENVPLDRLPWVALAMLLSMLALLWSGITLVRRQSNVAILVLMLSALLGLPFSLFILAIAFSD